MVKTDRCETRVAEIEEILEQKPGTRAVRDEEGRYTVVGAASSRTFADWLTPVAEHFVYHRNDIPDADTETWWVHVMGVSDEERLSMECAGNDRGHHDPETGSVQWGASAVATAVWTGTPVRAVLKDCRVDVDRESDRWLTVVGGDPPADHERSALPRTGRTAAGSGVEEVDPLVPQPLLAAHGIPPEGVAAVHDDVALVDILAGRPVRHR